MKEVKTNAMRFLDRHKITYEVIQYECDELVDGLKQRIYAVSLTNSRLRRW